MPGALRSRRARSECIRLQDTVDLRQSQRVLMLAQQLYQITHAAQFLLASKAGPGAGTSLTLKERTGNPESARAAMADHT